MKDLSPDDRPRAKLLRHGVAALGDNELVALVIGSGSRLDNMIHIGHDTVLGKNCLLAAQVGIAGAVEIGNGVILWGQVGVSKTLSIGDNVTVLAQSGVGGTIEPGKIYFGSPAEDASIKKRELVWIKRIPELWQKVNDRSENSGL